MGRKRVVENASMLRKKLNWNGGGCRVSEFNSTCYLNLILNPMKLGFEDSSEFCRAFLQEKKYKLLPLDTGFGHEQCGVRVSLTEEAHVYEQFAAELRDF